MHFPKWVVAGFSFSARGRPRDGCSTRRQATRRDFLKADDTRHHVLQPQISGSITPYFLENQEHYYSENELQNDYLQRHHAFQRIDRTMTGLIALCALGTTGAALSGLRYFECAVY